MKCWKTIGLGYPSAQVPSFPLRDFLLASKVIAVFFISTDCSEQALVAYIPLQRPAGV